MLASTASDIFWIAFAAGIFGVCVAAMFVLYKAGLNLTSTKEILDGVKDEAVPMLGDVRVTIQNVNHCLKALCKLIESEKFKTVALPRLATGVGGLDWKDVKPLMEKHLGHLSIPVYVYDTYHPGVQAEE